MNKENRLNDLIKFYQILNNLERKVGQKYLLANCNGRYQWPERGIYFFFDSNQLRADSGAGLRVMRVGTHALTKKSKTTLWNRLSQHKGQIKTGGGNHRGSIFRLLVGTAIINNLNLNYPTWGKKSSASREIRQRETSLEIMVSEVIGKMPFLYLPLNDEPGPKSNRAYIERNSIALLSNYKDTPLDPPSDSWLGFKCNRDKVRYSHLWNQRHVDESNDSDFLDVLENYVTSI